MTIDRRGRLRRRLDVDDPVIFGVDNCRLRPGKPRRLSAAWYRRPRKGKPPTNEDSPASGYATNGESE